MTSEPLKLIALDDEDLPIISAHLQDAVLRVGDMSYLARENRFVAIVNRFDWHGAVRRGGSSRRYERRRSALRIERVLAAKMQGIKLAPHDAVLSVLSIEFEASEAPAGFLTFLFSGGGAMRLEVECIEISLSDLGPAWSTRNKPEHAVEDDERGPDREDGESRDAEYEA